ncbi:hypothetical protein MKW98_030243 [Papaver atlanticum]|uniref:Uncharacterized protein n=1 Tax=Papaver atlanticum TaxID=357466 RepID=A0AAD4T187_9MAGN|nr:hypothetical protein MKW98_030243 [Papaver atlanticum]
MKSGLMDMHDNHSSVGWTLEMLKLLISKSVLDLSLANNVSNDATVSKSVKIVQCNLFL